MIKKNKSIKIKFIDLFAGAGGLSVGLEEAGFESVLGIDNDKPSLDTYKHNHKNAEVILGDIRDIDTKKIKTALKGNKIRLVCGGPPCQGFSTVGTNNPLDKRNHLFLEFVRVVKDLKPDYILLENVTGLISKSNENTLKSIIGCFTDLGYKIDVKVLSAHHYGVPETRRRTIILGNRFGVKNIFPLQTHKNSHDDKSNLPAPNSVKWAFENLIADKNKKNLNNEKEYAEIKNKLERSRIEHIPEGKGVRYEWEQKKYLPKNLWFELDWSQISEGRFRQTKLKRLSYSEPSPTINTSRNTYYHPKEHRYLTAREAAAIQSFPSMFKFLGTQTQQWQQIGNAVPPLLSKAIGKAILELDEKKDKMEKVEHRDTIAEIRSTAFVYRNYKGVKQVDNQLELEV